MLRRKPTAITITADDIAAFEDLHAKQVEYLKNQNRHNLNPNSATAPTDAGDGVGASGSSATAHQGSGAAQSDLGMLDPNDELKPLPGDKARIVRTREERIGGVGGGGGGGGRGRRG